MRTVMVALLVLAACVQAPPPTPIAPRREGTQVAAGREATWSALVHAWAENARVPGTIRLVDSGSGLLLATLGGAGIGEVVQDLPGWGTCTGIASMTFQPDSVTWTVVVEGDSLRSRVLAKADLWDPGFDCVSHGGPMGPTLVDEAVADFPGVAGASEGSTLRWPSVGRPWRTIEVTEGTGPDPAGFSARRARGARPGPRLPVRGTAGPLHPRTG